MNQASHSLSEAAGQMKPLRPEFYQKRINNRPKR